MKNKICLAAVCLTAGLTITACGSGDVQTAESLSVTQVPVSSAAEESSRVPAETETAATESSAEETSVSLEEYEFCADETANEVYRNFFREKQYLPQIEWDSDIRYDLGYIDDDDYPEIFICEYVNHVYPIHIYRYNPENSTIEYIDGFSEEGHAAYRQREGIIISVYGSQGSYLTYVSKIDGTEVSFVDIAATDPTTMRYYVSYITDSKSTGAAHEIDGDWPADVNAEEVSEEAYDAWMDEVYNDNSYGVSYENTMKSVDLFE